MITFNLLEFLAAIEKGKGIIAVDLGRKSIGVAVSDPQLKYVQDYFQFDSRGRSCDAWYIQKIKQDYSGIVVGTPFSHTRNNGWLSFIDKFSAKLSDTTGKPILMQDESLSTIKALNIIGKTSRNRQRKWKDKLSAYCILEETLCTIMNCWCCDKIPS
ncbi:hypothetical protein NHE_0011 [Neorickettsia helminthoeca str. Oregon]|uniref:YqgF/RNase H-like domain-containing protein n=1 Tax=Neorickettsia helminthoeca str. Oregon TaxID=1286528 RepID=X5H2W5_9RICK|nr:RuvX/YqgF family protein [Neorickettsia helminthoeca]AHX10988.1 hypothetical protein NHE_0011 [Neorickettsia helminthoeca str. Oregon]